MPVSAHQEVVPRGGTVVRDLVDARKLFEDLANMPCDAKGVLCFVGKWGLPSSASSVPEICDQVRPLQRAVKLMEYKDWAGLERAVGRKIRASGDERSVRINLRYARVPGESKPRLFLEPDNLLSYGWIELIQIAAGETHLMRCLKCGRLFVLGEAKGTRRTRQYCSPRCRLAMHRSGRT
jgi:hypothetical protein